VWKVKASHFCALVHHAIRVAVRDAVRPFAKHCSAGGIDLGRLQR
jgi:hypothetical protein